MPHVFYDGKRMDFLVSSANITFSVKLPRPTQLAPPAQPSHPAQLDHPAQPAHTAQPAHPTIILSWLSDFTDIWISQISVTY